MVSAPVDWFTSDTSNLACTLPPSTSATVAVTVGVNDELPLPLYPPSAVPNGDTDIAAGLVGYES